jgi:hypothetical protein
MFELSAPNQGSAGSPQGLTGSHERKSPLLLSYSNM